MLKIDKIVSELLNSGKVSSVEALAIGSAVRTLAGLRDEVRREHCRKYGSISIEGAEELLTEVTK